MNIAFPAFFLLALVLPGFIFKTRLLKVENSSLENKPFEVSSSNALLAALIIQTIFALTTHFLIKSIDFELCIKLLIANKLTNQELTALTDSVGYVSVYFLVVYISSYILGLVLQTAILRFWDYKNSLFSFDTPWYYELRGKIDKGQNADFIKVACLVDSYLYYGILEDFYLNRSGDLDRVVLSSTLRRPISVDDQGDQQERFYEVKGDRFVIKYSEVKNINIEHISLQEEN